jgi:GNAT superfamily N-acetyltransferase
VEDARLATAADVARLAELARAGRDELSAMRGGRVWAAREARPDPVEDGLASAVADPAQRVLAGTIDGAVVGYAVGRVEALAGGERLGVIDDLFVEEGARSVGVGECLMAALLEWFREQGCCGVDAMALPGHRATKNFFEESGFTARQIVMHRPLAGE